MTAQNALVWANEPWWLENAAIHEPHCVSVSETKPRLLAYWQSELKRSRNIRTPIKPGRYLTQFFGSVLTAKKIAYYAAWQSSGAPPADDGGPKTEVQFATTPDEIELVYLTGPNSCMSHPARDYDSSEHPVRVYGAGDLAIAYLFADGFQGNLETANRGDVISRAICWPERKVYGRVYPTEDEALQDDLRNALTAIGYQSHIISAKSFDGARMLRIEEDDCVAMPYLDAPVSGFDDGGTHLILRTRGGDYAGQSTDGTVEWEPSYGYTCERCGDGFDEDGETVYTRAHPVNGGRGEQYWCYDCANNHTFRCEGFGETFSDADVSYEYVDGDRYTVAWLEENAHRSDYSGDWFLDDPVEMENGDTWSRDEFERYGFTCAITDKRYANTEMHLEHSGVHLDVSEEELAGYLGTTE